MRRAITRADEAMVREKIAKAIGFGDERIGLEWHDGKAIQVRIAPLAGTYREPSQSERRMLAERGIFPGADGWEIEEEPAKPERSPLPPDFGWYEHGYQSYGLDRKPNGETIARAIRGVDRWVWTLEKIGEPWVSAEDLPSAKAAAEDVCRKAGLFEPAKPERRPLPAGWKWERRREIQVLLPGEEDRDGCWIAEAHPSGLWKAYRDLEAVAPVAQDTAEPRTIEAAQEAAERVCWARGLFGAPVEPTGTIIGERSAASTALRRLVLRALNRAEDGGMIDPLVYPGAAAHLSDLCDAFVSELRAELAPKPEPSADDEDGGAESMVPREELDAMAERAMKYQRKEEGARFSLATMLGCAGMWSEIEKKVEALKRKPSPSPRTTDGALTAYLLEHYRDEWRTDDTAETLAIRLLGETQQIVDSAHEEAEASDANAKEMAAELAKVRADRDRNGQWWAEAEHDRDVAREAARKAEEAREEARAATREATKRAEDSIASAERISKACDRLLTERDEARTDLAVLRGLCRGFAEKVGVPHG